MFAKFIVHTYAEIKKKLYLDCNQQQKVNKSS